MKLNSPLLFLGIFPGNKNAMNILEPICEKEKSFSTLFDMEELFLIEGPDQLLHNPHFCPYLTDSQWTRDKCKLCEKTCLDE
ncbi:MAG: hypothetical protein ACEPOZ_01365 [Marinifilaceae bacterium]